MNFHERRKLPWSDLRTEVSLDTPLHLAVSSLRLQELAWMATHGYQKALVRKNADGRTVTQLLKAAVKQLRQDAKRKKAILKAEKQGLPPPPPIFRPPPQRIVTVEAALKGEPGPTAQPPPAGKKGKKGKGKTKKAPKSNALGFGLDEALFRLKVKTPAEGVKALQAMSKRLVKFEEEEMKELKKLEAEKKKADAKKKKDAKAEEDKKKKKK